MSRNPKKKIPKSGAAGVRYRISVHDAAAHLFAVEVTIDDPDPRGQRVMLPVWIPGSYMVREFARNIVSIEAFAGSGRKRSGLDLLKLDKTTWQAESAPGPLTLEYLVYAYDLSVRAAHLDTHHGFFNATSVFLSVEGLENRRHEVDIVRPRDARSANWRLVTTLQALDVDDEGFGRYAAKDYDELADHPVEMGTIVSVRFQACGTPHEIALTGQIVNLDAKRLAADVKRVCEAQIRLFEPERAKAPFARYAFLTTAVGEGGYGGLEHRSCTALLCSRDDLPRLHQVGRDDAYRGFLGLVSHEYFHSWNVKRIKPQAFVPYRLHEENYTRLLWIFEGFTSYYDDLMLVRTRLFSEEQYLAALAKTISDVHRSRGRLRQSVAESSFDAWTKYYRQDENSPNAIVSYYRKGSLVALALDLTIRAATNGRKSLDDVMRRLWTEFGLPFDSGEPVGLGEDEFPRVVLEATGVDLSAEIARWAYGTEDLPLERLFKAVGVKLDWSVGANRASLGIRAGADPAGVKIISAYEGEAAHRSGLSALDVIIAVGGLRVTHASLVKILSRYAPGETVQVHAFRRDEIVDVMLTLDHESPGECKLVAGKANRLRSGWLKEEL